MEREGMPDNFLDFDDEELEEAIERDWQEIREETKQKILEILDQTKEAFIDNDYDEMFREIRKAI